MAGQVTLTFAGDSKALEKASAAARAAISSVGDQVAGSGAQFQSAGKEASSFRDRMDRLGTKTFETVSSLDAARAAVTDLADAQSRSKRAANDLRQAQEDLNQAHLDARQATRDAAQAVLDTEQAGIDAAAAQRDYNAAVKEFGKDSIEARQAALDIKQAQEDGAQASEDAAQAIADGRQASIDAEAAALDMAEAQREAADVTKIMAMAIAGATIAQLALNIAMTLNPIGLVVVAIAALVAGIIWLATQTTFFQDTWKVMTEAIGVAIEWLKGAWNDGVAYVQGLFARLIEGAQSIPGRIQSAFSGLVNILSWPFRTAFNLISDAWNNTVGRLRWTVPNWVPSVGGNTIAAPTLPKFHAGGVVPGAPGSEMLAVLQAGERVQTQAQQQSQGRGIGADDLRMMSGSGLDRVFLQWLEGVLRANNLRLVRS